MKTQLPLKRRDFLTGATGILALAGLTDGVGLSQIAAADNPPSLTRPATEASEKVLSELEGKGAEFLNVPRKDGQFLSLLVKVARAKNVLEVGTSHGYSAIWIARGLEETGGKLTTVEIRPERVNLAKEHLRRAGLSNRVTFKEGDAHKIVPTLEGPFDFVFLDGDKDGLMDYFSKLFPKKLLPGGLVVAHNAISKREAMKDFLDIIAAHADFDSVILSLTMEDGLSLSRRRLG